MNFKLKTAVITAISMGALVLASAQTATFQFTQNLKLGSSGAQVMQLQKTLNSTGYTVATAGVGSAGKETSYFGAATKRAVIKFQSANGVPATGNVFALTRAALNGTSVVVVPPTGTSTPVVSGPVTVSLASAQPNNMLVTGSARATLATFVFSGNGSVTNVKLMRTGVSNNSSLGNVYLYDAATGVRLTDAATALTDSSISFNNPSGIFAVAGSRTVNVVADIASGATSQTIGVSLVGYATMGNPAAVVSGINGPILPTGTAGLASVYFNTSNAVASQSINAGTIGTSVWTNTLNIGTRAVNFYSATFKMVGSATYDSLANVKLYVDGVQAGNASSFSATGYVTFNLTSPLSLTTGSHTFDVRGDVVKGSNRSFYVQIENAGDFMVQDSSVLGTNITVLSGSTTGAAIQNFAAGTISVNPGSLTITQNPNFTATTVVGGSTSQVLGSYKFMAYGEDVKVTTLTATVATTSAATPSNSTALNNVTVYVNGGAVTSGVAATIGTATSFTLGSNLIVPAGSSTIVEIRGDLVNSAGTNVSAGTFTANLTAVTNGAQGMTSFNLTNVPAASGQSISVNNGNVSFGVTSGFGAANISANQSHVLIGSYTLQAGSAEAVNVTNIAIGLTGSSTVGTDYTNLSVTDGLQTIVPTATNNFSVNYTVNAGQTKAIYVYADTLQGATGKTIIPNLTVSFRGLTSRTNNTASSTSDPAMTFTTVTVGTPTIVGASSLGSRYVMGGSTVNSVVSYNVQSPNGNAMINDLYFTASSSIQSLTIGNTTATNVGGNINFYGINLSVPAGTGGLNVPVSVTYAPVTATGQGGIASGVTANLVLGGDKYTAGGTVTTNAVGAISVSGSPMTLVASLATVKKTSTGTYLGTGSVTSVKLGTVSVSADLKGDITIGNVPVSVSLPTGGVLATTTIIVKANGTNLAGTTGYVAPTSATSGFNFGTTGYRISAGQTVAFDIYGDVSGVTTAGNADISLGSAGSFAWGDIVGGTATTTGPLTGTLLNSYNN